MSCGTSCACQFNWPLDTHGFKRDAISSEKGWLDFAVRCLSREVTGKGHGQETVWNVACKPSWWDSDVGLPWKNPTTNPKDNKDILLQKYEALERHLRSKNRFPPELEEEAKLWSEKKYKELFLYRDLMWLRKNVSLMHLAFEDACSKAEKMKACINEDLLTNIKACLTSSVKLIESQCRKECPKVSKRCRNVEQQNVDTVPSKKLKRVNEKRFVPILPKSNPNIIVPTETCSDSLVRNDNVNGANPEVIFNLANKVLEKQRNLSKHKTMSIRTAPSLQKTETVDQNNVIPPENVASNASPSSWLPLDLIASAFQQGNDPLPELSEGIDFLLSPQSGESSPCKVPLNSETTQKHRFPTGIDLDQPVNIDLGNIAFDIFSTAKDSPDSMSENNPSPLSSISETPSLAVLSDRGYISDDLDLDIDFHEEGTKHLELDDNFCLETFLYGQG